VTIETYAVSFAYVYESAQGAKESLAFVTIIAYTINYPVKMSLCKEYIKVQFLLQ
jgi:hypothetical protein